MSVETVREFLERTNEHPIAALSIIMDLLDLLDEFDEESCATLAGRIRAEMQKGGDVPREIARLWNQEHPIKTPVVYESIKGDPSTRRETKTCSEAFLAESGTPVIFVEGVSGYVALDHVSLKKHCWILEEVSQYFA